jgi:ring-1,2-phenylacetyl-CoA epoxidase subunit PaaD
MIAHAMNEINKIRNIISQVTDPEVPVLSIIDLGIIRDIKIENEIVEITITPTYTGCPAMDIIKMNIRMVLLENGFKNISIKQILSPAWTTDWITENGKDKLKAYGIAPPNSKQVVCSSDVFQTEEAIQCPQCNSYNTVLISQFGSTACKALYRCNDCKEAFDYFKCH